MNLKKSIYRYFYNFKCDNPKQPDSHNINYNTGIISAADVRERHITSHYNNSPSHSHTVLSSI